MGERVSEEGHARLVETGEFRVTEEFNRAFAGLTGTLTINAVSQQIFIVIDSLTLASFSFIGTDVTDDLVPFVNSRPQDTLVVTAKDRELKVQAAIRVIFI